MRCLVFYDLALWVLPWVNRTLYQVPNKLKEIGLVSNQSRFSSIPDRGLRESQCIPQSPPGLQCDSAQHHSLSCLYEGYSFTCPNSKMSRSMCVSSCMCSHQPV